jgi:hypothetical protein
MMFFALYAGSLVFAAEKVATVIELPDLATAAAWTADGDELEIGETGDYLTIGLKNLPPQKKVMLRLREPVPVPAGMELNFSAALSQIYELNFLPVVRDANGTEFAFEPTSRASVKGGCFIGGYFYQNGLHRVGEVMVRTEGMRTFTRGTYKRVAKTYAKPELPVTLIGAQLWTRRKQTHAAKSVFYVRNFKLTDVDHRNCRFYYQFQGKERFVETDGKPAFSFDDFSQFWGERFVVDWDVRDQYAGQPFQTGTAECIPDANSQYPPVLQLSRKLITLPVSAPGVYWVRAKMRGYNRSSEIPVKIINREYRLYIIRGEETDAKSTKSARPDRIGSSLVRIAPERNFLVWDANEPFKLKVRFFDAAGHDCRVEVNDSAGKAVKTAKRKAVGATEDVELDLTGSGPGSLTVTAAVLAGNQLMDEETLLIGRKASHKDLAPFKFPAGIATASEMKNGPALAQLDFHMQHDAKYADTLKHAIPFLKPITNHFEFRCDWNLIEQYPGIYDFRELDDMLADANEKGAKIQLFFSIKVPEWAPSHYTRNTEGKIFGHNTYLFHGARLNLFQSPVLRPAYLEFVRNAVLHYRNHPAVESYYLLIEHPGEASYKGWYEGFDDFTIANFRQAMRNKYQTIAALNQAWKTDWADFDTLMPAKPKTEASSQFWYDWISFREESVWDFKEEVIATIRKHDPKRLIMVYGAGHERYGKYNVMTANGGCRKPEKFGYGMMKVADLNQGQRAEEVSVTNWYGFYPTHLDTSLFSMMMGGGKNAFCKMFFPVRSLPKNGDLSQIRRKNGLERYEKFIPIWQELRNTEVPYKDIRLYTNDDGYRVERKSTFHPGGSPWDTYPFLESQLPFWVAPGTNWLQAKMVVAFSQRLNYLFKRDMDTLGNYVKDGGVLVMGVEAGKTRIEDDAPYTMLKEFGFNAPSVKHPSIPFPIYTPDQKEKLGLLRHLYERDPVKSENVLAVTKKGEPAITWKAYGKGTVYVLWAGSNVPTSDKQGKDIDTFYLREIARRHGLTIPTNADSIFVWTNLLKDKRSQNWYLLVMRDKKERDGATPPTTVTLDLPPGNYRVTELINGKVDWRKSSADLATNGFQLTLAEKEVAILKFDYEK